MSEVPLYFWRVGVLILTVRGLTRTKSSRWQYIDTNASPRHHSTFDTNAFPRHFPPFEHGLPLAAHSSGSVDVDETYASPRHHTSPRLGYRRQLTEELTAQGALP